MAVHARKVKTRTRARAVLGMLICLWERAMQN